MSLGNRNREAQIKASRKSVGLVNNNPVPTHRVITKIGPSNYEKKKACQFTLTPSLRYEVLPEITQAMGLRSDSATLEFLIKAAHKQISDPSWNKDQMNIWDFM
jgi:shikimate kinase